MSKTIIIEDGNIKQTIQDNILWDGKFSKAHANGPIINFLQIYLPKHSLMVIPRSDGNINRNHNNQYHDVDWDTQIQPHIDYAKEHDKIFILGTLAQEFEEPDINYFYLPLDDDFFKYGVNNYFYFLPVTSWEARSNQLCWRGGCSGYGDSQAIRVKFTEKIYDHDPNTNVRLSNWWSDNKNIPDYLFSDRIDHTEFFKYKIFFIVDGNVIASNHMYGFASGSVPFIISKAKCWFTDFIIPFVHYIPIKYDLSDLIEKIEWVNENDELAKKIAENAYEFSRTHFSPEYQKRYIKNQIQQLL
jgi:hypothetical protein